MGNSPQQTRYPPHAPKRCGPEFTGQFEHRQSLAVDRTWWSEPRVVPCLNGESVTWPHAIVLAPQKLSCRLCRSSAIKPSRVLWRGSPDMGALVRVVSLNVVYEPAFVTGQAGMVGPAVMPALPRACMCKIHRSRGLSRRLVSVNRPCE